MGSEAGVGSTFAFYVRCRRGTVPQNGVEPDREAKVKKLHKLKESLPLRTDKTPPVSIAPSAPLVDYKQLHVLIVEDNLVSIISECVVVQPNEARRLTKRSYRSN